MKNLYIILLCLPLIVFGQGWEQTFGGPDPDSGRSVQQTSDGGYIITGLTGSFWNDTMEDVYLIKTNEYGTEQWYYTFGGTGDEWGHSVQQTTDGGYIITGTTDSYGDGNYDVYLIKTNEYGTEQWSQTFGGTGDEWGHSVQQTTDGGYIITGPTDSYGDGNVYLIKTDGNGIEQWSQTFGGIESYSVKQTSDGGYIITGLNGWTKQINSSDVYLLKTDGDGIEQWSQTFGGTGVEWGHSVQQTTDGGYIICGITDSYGDGNYDVYLIKTNEYGTEQWSQTFGGTGIDLGHSVQQTTDGGYIITGNKYNGVDGNFDVYLIKTDYEGNTTFTSTIELPTPTRKRELVKTINIIGQENTTIKNQPLIEIYDDGSVEKKYIIE